jgi:hypothetical protein
VTAPVSRPRGSRTPGISYVATVHHGANDHLFLRIVCRHCGEEHENEIDPLESARQLQEPGFEVLAEAVAGLALVAVWMASHTTGHDEAIRRGTEVPS